MVCCFFGHGDAPYEIRPQLMETLEGLITDGIDSFLVGHQGRFDRIVLSGLRELKMKYPHLNYYVVLAYMPGTKSEYEEYAPGETLFPEGLEFIHPRYAISWRNNYLINNSNVVVTYITHSWGGAAKYAEKAGKQGKRIINIVEKRT